MLTIKTSHGKYVNLEDRSFDEDSTIALNRMLQEYDIIQFKIFCYINSTDTSPHRIIGGTVERDYKRFMDETFYGDVDYNRFYAKILLRRIGGI